MENLTIESLARALHETLSQANQSVSGQPLAMHSKSEGFIDQPAFDELPVELKKIRREQARLLFERIMR